MFEEEKFQVKGFPMADYTLLVPKRTQLLFPVMVQFILITEEYMDSIQHSALQLLKTSHFNHTILEFLSILQMSTHPWLSTFYHHQLGKTHCVSEMQNVLLSCKQPTMLFFWMNQLPCHHLLYQFTPTISIQFIHYKINTRY